MSAADVSHASWLTKSHAEPLNTRTHTKTGLLLVAPVFRLPYDQLLPVLPSRLGSTSNKQLAACEGWNSVVPAVCGALVGGLYVMDTMSIQTLRLPGVVYRCFAVSPNVGE